MTDLLNIDLAKFKAHCTYKRASLSVMTDADFAMLARGGITRRAWHKSMLDAEEFRKEKPVDAALKSIEEKANELRAELIAAARFSVAGNFGATRDQIEAIVMIAKAENDFSGYSNINRLTRADANHIIDFAAK